MVEVLAEIGSCHDGSLQRALKLIQVARDCGADVVKAQFWSSAKRMAKRRKAFGYESIYAKYQVPESWLPVMRAEANLLGMKFACSSYLPEDVEIVAEHAEILKIASFEANDPQLLVAHRPYMAKGRRIVVSLGFSGSADEAERWLGYADIQLPSSERKNLQFLHCVTAYPAPLPALSLSKIGWSNQGYSDHSGDRRVGAWAVMRGAAIIEAHLRLHATDSGNPDAGKHALSPEDFSAYVREIRDAELAMYGDSAEAEAPMSEYAVRPYA